MAEETAVIYNRYTKIHLKSDGTGYRSDSGEIPIPVDSNPSYDLIIKKLNPEKHCQVYYEDENSPLASIVFLSSQSGTQKLLTKDYIHSQFHSFLIYPLIDVKIGYLDSKNYDGLHTIIYETITKSANTNIVRLALQKLSDKLRSLQSITYFDRNDNVKVKEFVQEYEQLLFAQFPDDLIVIIAMFFPINDNQVIYSNETNGESYKDTPKTLYDVGYTFSDVLIIEYQ